MLPYLRACGVTELTFDHFEGAALRQRSQTASLMAQNPK
jgi:hypothetical protein